MDPAAPLEEMSEAARLLPAQFFPSAPESPVKGLMRAVLERAIEDLRGGLTSRRGSQARRRVQHEAEAWFLSADDRYLYSFINICQALNLDAGAIRRALLAPQREAA